MNRYNGDLVTKWTDLLKQKHKQQQIAHVMALAWLD